MSWNLLGDVLHHLELTTRGVDLGDGSGLQLVNKLAKDGPVLEHLLEGFFRRELGAEDGLNPFLGFLLLLGVALGSELLKLITYKVSILISMHCFLEKSFLTCRISCSLVFLFKKCGGINFGNIKSNLWLITLCGKNLSPGRTYFFVIGKKEHNLILMHSDLSANLAFQRHVVCCVWGRVWEW